MKTITQTYQMDEFACNELSEDEMKTGKKERTPRLESKLGAWPSIVDDFFAEKEKIRKFEIFSATLPSPLHRRIAWAIYIDGDEATASHFSLTGKEWKKLREEVIERYRKYWIEQNG